MIEIQSYVTALYQKGWTDEQIKSEIKWERIDYDHSHYLRTFHVGHWLSDLVLNFPMVVLIISFITIGAATGGGALGVLGLYWGSIYLSQMPYYVDAGNEHIRDDAYTLRPIKYIIVTGILLLLSLLLPLSQALLALADLVSFIMLALPGLLLIPILWFGLPALVEFCTIGRFTHLKKEEHPPWSG